MAPDIVDFRTQRRFKDKLKLLPLATTTCLWNLARWSHDWLKPSNRTSDRHIRKLVILGFGGIGNHIMLIPAIAAIKRVLPRLDIHLITSSGVCRDLLQSDPHLWRIRVMDIRKRLNLFDYHKIGKQIRTIGPDAVMAAAGTDPVAGSLMAWFSGARIRVGEDWRGRGAFYTFRRPVHIGISEARQNLGIARLLQPQIQIPSAPISPRIYLSAREIQQARQWLHDNGWHPDRPILGIHPGCGAQQKWKRWPIDRFIQIARKMATEKSVFVVFFAGPDETDLVSSILPVISPSIRLFPGKQSIRHTAATIGWCNLFVSNDSGLRHIATALGVPTIGIFGPTGTEKNFLALPGHRAIFHENARCRPCHYTAWWLACGHSRPCLKEISVNRIIHEINQYL